MVISEHVQCLVCGFVMWLVLGSVSMGSNYSVYTMFNRYYVTLVSDQYKCVCVWCVCVCVCLLCVCCVK